MLPIEEQTQVAAPHDRVGELLTGDLGVVVVRALLEQGVGYVVSSWRDRPTPIDAAIDDARERVLSPNGVVLRRLRSLAALEPIVTAPTGGITGSPPRGAVVFAGRRGMRPALERFVALRSSGSVVGFCFDDDVMRIEDAIVIDPEPTAIGLVRAIDDAFAASLAAGRPALVLIRERALGMRGTIRVRPVRSPHEAAEADALARAQHGAGNVDVPVAVAQAGLVEVRAGGAGDVRRVVMVNGPLRQAVERACAELVARSESPGVRALVGDIDIVSLRVIGVLPDPDSIAGRALQASERTCVLGTRAARTVERLQASGHAGALDACPIDPATARGEQILHALAAWLYRDLMLDGAARERLAPLVEPTTTVAVAGLVSAPRRVPRRGEVLHRGVSPAVAAGLALAQGVIGVPARIDAAWPTYRADTGVPLTIVPAAIFAAHGAASAAPGSGSGVFVVTGNSAGVAEAAAAAAATVEFVDGSAPRLIGASIGRACRAPRVASHVIIVSEVRRVAAPRTATFGMDPELVGTERLATSAVPTSATALVDLGDELLNGPAVLALDLPEAHAALGPLRELSPATWDLSRRGPAQSRLARLSWNLRRRAIRAAAGVDL